MTPETERRVHEALDGLDAICDRAVDLQRELLARAFGPDGPLTLPDAVAANVAVVTAGATLSRENLGRLASELRADSRFRDESEVRP